MTTETKTIRGFNTSLRMYYPERIYTLRTNPPAIDEEHDRCPPTCLPFAYSRWQMVEAEHVARSWLRDLNSASANRRAAV